MTYHWFAHWRRANLIWLRTDHRYYCADCHRGFLCLTDDTYSRKIEHWTKVQQRKRAFNR